MLACAPMLASAQSDSGKVVIMGMAYNKNDSTPAALVNVYDKATGIGTSTAKNGSFALKVPIGDTIVFTSLEYESKFIIARERLNNVMFAIYLAPSIHPLPVVTPIDPNGIKNMHVQEKPKMKLDLPKLEKDKTSGKDSQSPGKLLSFGSNPNKEIEKQEKEIRKFNGKEKTSGKYNREMVMRATKLNEKQADDFMKFCYIADDVLESGAEYDMLLAIKQCYKSYLAAHPELKK